jgi:outer membrane protein TolC
VLRALGETETALSAYRNALLRKATLKSARDAAASAARISLARQRQGQIDFLSVLDAQRTLAQSDADLAQATRDVAFAQVDLFRALGGSWRKDVSRSEAATSGAPADRQVSTNRLS